MSIFEELAARELEPAERDTVLDATREDINSIGGAKLLAALLGRSKGTIYGWTERDERNNKLIDVARLAKFAGSRGDLIRALARLAGGTFCPYVPSDEPLQLLDTLRNAAQLMSHCGLLCNQLTRYVEDGELDDRERAKLLPAIEQVDEVVEKLRLIAQGA